MFLTCGNINYMSYKTSLSYIIHEISQSITTQSEQILSERFGIGFSQYKVLLCLEEQSGVTQKSIATQLNQTEASISRQISVLYGKNLIIIRQGKDSRQNLIFPTSRGVEVITKATKALNDFSDLYLDSIKPKELKNLDNYLSRINKYLTR